MSINVLRSGEEFKILGRANSGSWIALTPFQIPDLRYLFRLAGERIQDTHGYSSDLTIYKGERIENPFYLYWKEYPLRIIDDRTNNVVYALVRYEVKVSDELKPGTAAYVYMVSDCNEDFPDVKVISFTQDKDGRYVLTVDVMLFDIGDWTMDRQLRSDEYIMLLKQYAIKVKQDENHRVRPLDEFHTAFAGKR